MKRVTWDRPGILAMRASALGMSFDVPDQIPGVSFTPDGIAIVGVGFGAPMSHNASWFGDSYDAVKARIAAALESPAKAVVLEIDTPGGDVFGCFEAARAIREMADASKKPLIAYTESLAASGGYALACAADLIVVSDEGHVGSVGVISALVSQARLDEAMGLRFEVFGSGARKTDGCPHVEITEEASAELRAHVTSLAEVFFAWVADRRGMTPDEVRALEAGVFHGASAVSAKLADEVVQTKNQLLAKVASGDTASAVERKATMADEKDKEEKDESSPQSYADEMRARLEEDAKSDDEDKASAAKKMLAALDGEGGEDKPAKDADKPKGEDEEDGKSKALAAVAAGTSDATVRALVETVADLQAQIGGITKETRKTRRTDLIASHELPAALAKSLSTEKLETVERIVAGFPKKTPRNLAAAEQPGIDAAVPRGTADPNAPRASRMPAEQKEKLDERMGLKAVSDGGIKKDRNFVTLGIVPRKKDQKTAPTAPGKVA
jgi:signal peptide peptidase SppA